MIPFYDEFFSFELYSDNSAASLFKDARIRSMLSDDCLYKFISFTDNVSLNDQKVRLLQNHEFWASNYKQFHDRTELHITHNPMEIARKTGWSLQKVNQLIATTKQMNDVACFTCNPTDFMWDNYANNRSGICLRFSLHNSDCFYPVAYLDKLKISLTADYIRSIRTQGKVASNKVAILPWVMKNTCFQLELEIRFLYGSLYDDENGIMGGRIWPDKKELMAYTGNACSWDQYGLTLEEIIIGERCPLEYVEQIEQIVARV
jgi:hypothetical protein